MDVFIAACGQQNHIDVHPRDGRGFHKVPRVQTFVPVGMVKEEGVSILVVNFSYQGDLPEFDPGVLVPGEDSCL